MIINKSMALSSYNPTSRNNRIYTTGVNKGRIKSISPTANGPEYYLIFKEYERFIERSDLPSTNNDKAGSLLFEK